MRLAVVHSFYSRAQPSGENSVVEAEVAALRRAGHEVRLFAVQTDRLRARALYELRTAARVATGVGRSPLRPLARFSPDLVHVHNLFPNIGRRWVGKLPFPLVTTLHNYRPICVNGQLLRAGHVCTLCPDGDGLGGVRHACYRGSRLASLPQALANLGGPARDPLLRRADRVIVPSQRAAEVFERYGLDARRIEMWPHFVPRDLDPGPVVGAGGEGWLFVGRLAPDKGIARLVDAWPTDVPLRVVGDGPDATAVTAAAVGKRVQVLGPRTRAEIVDLMVRATGLVFPSLWWETFGMVTVEALACGLPTLAWRPSLVADRVSAEGTGTAVNWSDALSKALRAAESTFPAMRAACRATFEERYSEDVFVRRAERLFGELSRHAERS